MSDGISDIEPHQQVALYPTFGHLDRAGENWIVHLRGIVYEEGEERALRRLLKKFLTRAMQVESHELESALAAQRLSGFMTAHEPGQRIAVRVGSHAHILRCKTQAATAFLAVSCKLSLAEVANACASRATCKTTGSTFEVLSRHREHCVPRPGPNSLAPPA